MMLPALAPARAAALELLPGAARALAAAAAPWGGARGATPSPAGAVAPPAAAWAARAQLQPPPGRRGFATSEPLGAAPPRRSCSFHTGGAACAASTAQQAQPAAAPPAAAANGDSAEAPPDSVVAPLAKAASPPAGGAAGAQEALYSLRQVGMGRARGPAWRRIARRMHRMVAAQRCAAAARTASRPACAAPAWCPLKLSPTRRPLSPPPPPQRSPSTPPRTPAGLSSTAPCSTSPPTWTTTPAAQSRSCSTRVRGRRRPRWCTDRGGQPGQWIRCWGQAAAATASRRGRPAAAAATRGRPPPSTRTASPPPGVDCSDEFNGIHSADAKALLQKFRIGALAGAKKKPAAAAATTAAAAAPAAEPAAKPAAAPVPPAAAPSHEAPAAAAVLAEVREVFPGRAAAAPDAAAAAALAADDAALAVAPVALADPRVRYDLPLESVRTLNRDTLLLRFALPSAAHRVGLPCGKHVFIFAGEARGWVGGEWGGGFGGLAGDGAVAGIRQGDGPHGAAMLHAWRPSRTPHPIPKQPPDIDGESVARAYTPISSDRDLGHLDFMLKVREAGGGGEQRGAARSPTPLPAPRRAWSAGAPPTRFPPKPPKTARCTGPTRTPTSRRAARCRSTLHASRWAWCGRGGGGGARRGPALGGVCKNMG
jgi:hypothetical protein